MQFYSTRNKSDKVSLKEALFKGLPDDNGLYMPLRFNKLPSSLFENIEKLSFEEIAYQIAKTFLTDSIPTKSLRKIINEAINFPAPVVSLTENTHILELFHGPSLAFKDFGARFMAEAMSYYLSAEKKEIVILVATSGDTGGAVAAGFYKTPGIKIVILYPKGKVSLLQEKQLTTLGENITALQIDGTFDDCQKLVKLAFLDADMRARINLSSANSINIARLIPQSFYYFEAYKQLRYLGRELIFVVPSGNFGNLTAGLFAQRLGLPVKKFIAAVNANDVFSKFIESGVFVPKVSVRTLSNAMDVGNPSNFARIDFLYSSTWNKIRKNISAFSFNDTETENTMREVKSRFNYVIEPHAAVGYLAWQKYISENKNETALGVILGTAHAAKFHDDVVRILNAPIEIPENLKNLLEKENKSVALSSEFETFKSYLLSNFAN